MMLWVTGLLLMALLATLAGTVVGQTVAMLGIVVLVGVAAALGGNWLFATLIWAVWTGAIIALAVVGTTLRGGKAGDQMQDGVAEAPGKDGWSSWILLLLGLAVAAKIPQSITDWHALVWDPAQLFVTRVVWLEAASVLLLGALIVALRILTPKPEEDT